MRRRFDLQTTIALLLLAVAVALPIPGLMGYQGPPMEEGFMLAFPQRILAGAVPHVDFLHLYGPGSLYVLAGVYKVFGDTLEVERIVGIVQHCLLIFAMFWFARPWGRVSALFAGLITLVITISPLGLSAMAWNGALGLAMAGIAVLVPGLDGGGRVRLSTAGVCFGAALLYRPDMIVAIGLTCVIAWLMLGRDPAARRDRWYGLAGAVVTSALIVPFLIAVGFERAIEGMFLQPVFDLRDGRTLPVPPSWSEPDGYLQKAGGLRVSRWPLPMLEIGPQIALWFWLVPVSVLFVVFAAWRCCKVQPERLRPRGLAVGAAFALGLLPQAFQRPDTAHLSWVSCVSFALVPLAILELWTIRTPLAGEVPSGVTVKQGIVGLVPALRRSLARPVAAVLPILFVLVAVIPFYPLRTYADLVGQSFGHNVFGYEIVRGDRRFFYGSEEAAASAQRIVDRLDEESNAGQRLIVAPYDLALTPYSDAFFYYLFPELVPGTRYIEMDPGLADAVGSGLAEELANNDWLILSDVWSGWEEPNSSVERGDERPNEIVARDYCEVLDAAPFRLLQRCDRTRRGS
ncbi:MAG: hypothetical protein M9952_07910 [Microthrixaceae bacterium]|nr:hypothetical protein [Microthrixaceae bacterium]MCO5312841.1 hypothetical protein [Microthrixaceae bacterium]